MLSQDFRRSGYDPFSELRRMQEEFNRVFSEFSGAPTREFPPIKLWLGQDSVVVTAELPGVDRNHVSLNLQEDVLTLQGERRSDAPDDARWHRRERGYGSFSRTIQLPFRADGDKVQARFSNGVLEIELPRPQSDRARKIEIRTA